MTIKSKTILLLLVCSLVPLALISVESFLSARAALEAEVTRVLQADADATLARLEDFFDKAAVDFSSWSAAPEMQDALIDDAITTPVSLITMSAPKCGYCCRSRARWGYGK